MEVHFRNLYHLTKLHLGNFAPSYEQFVMWISENSNGPYFISSYDDYISLPTTKVYKTPEYEDFDDRYTSLAVELRRYCRNHLPTILDKGVWTPMPESQELIRMRRMMEHRDYDMYVPDVKPIQEDTNNDDNKEELEKIVKKKVSNVSYKETMLSNKE